MQSPSSALHELAVQHALLCEMMDRCETLADAVDAGTGEPGALLDEVARLRIAFDEHHRFEEQQLRPLLLDASVGAVRISRMVDDHVSEHRTMRHALRATPTAALRDVLADLRDHLATEDRHLLHEQR